MKCYFWSIELLLISLLKQYIIDKYTELSHVCVYFSGTDMTLCMHQLEFIRRHIQDVRVLLESVPTGKVLLPRCHLECVTRAMLSMIMFTESTPSQTVNFFRSLTDHCRVIGLFAWCESLTYRVVVRVSYDITTQLMLHVNNIITLQVCDTEDVTFHFNLE